MENRMSSNQRVLVAMRAVLALSLLAWAILGAAPRPFAGAQQPAPESPALTPVWTFSGGVYQGQSGDYTTPLSGVTVAIYGANSQAAWGHGFGRRLRIDRAHSA